jgi:aspartate/methionine/tyrosine aminotransferase
LSESEVLSYDPDPRGLLAARNAIAQLYATQGVELDLQNVFLTSSTSEAYAFLFRVLCNPGDSILVPKPSYPLFDYLCGLNDVDATPYQLRYDDEWRIDIELLSASVQRSTRAILLVHPNNPTGSFIRNNEREALVELARQHNLALIVDEVFHTYAFDEAISHERSFADETSVLTFTLGGISKLLGLPQMKLAWIAVSGPLNLSHTASARLEIVADTYLSVGTPVQHALPSLLRQGKNITDQITTRVRANHDLLRSRIDDSSSISVFNSAGGWNAILQLPRIRTDEEWAVQLLKDHRILVHPGHFFDLERDGCLVISLLPPADVFSKGIVGILETVKRQLNSRT